MESHDCSKIFQWSFSMLNHTNFNQYSQSLLLLLIFFTILILITSSFLCIHYRRRHSRTATASAAAPPTATPANSINTLPVLLLCSSVNNNYYYKETECSICLGVFQDEEKLKVLPACNHAYHSECVDKWLSSQPNCPLCRVSLCP